MFFMVLALMEKIQSVTTLSVVVMEKFVASRFGLIGRKLNLAP